MQLDQTQISDIAWHEAGHIVIAESFGLELLGFYIEKTSVSVKINVSQLNEFEHACVLMAGFFSAVKYSGVDDVTCMRKSASDCDEAEHLISITPGINRSSIREYIYKHLNDNKVYYYAKKIQTILDTNLVDISLIRT